MYQQKKEPAEPLREGIVKDATQPGRNNTRQMDLDGRLEKRVRIAVPLYLTRLAGLDFTERACTEKRQPARRSGGDQVRLAA